LLNIELINNNSINNNINTTCVHVKRRGSVATFVSQSAFPYLSK